MKKSQKFKQRFRCRDNDPLKEKKPLKAVKLRSPSRSRVVIAQIRAGRCHIIFYLSGSNIIPVLTTVYSMIPD